MSLDVTLYISNEAHSKWKTKRENSLIDAGNMKGLIPIIEDYYDRNEPSFNTTLFKANITHNLGKMALEAGIYEACWRPYYLHPDSPKEFSSYDEECVFEAAHPMLAKDIIQTLEKGYENMKARPEHFKKFDSENGWGTYNDFLPWVESYLNACRKYPDALIEISR